MKSERCGYPILTSAQSRAMDAAVDEGFGLPLAVLMENAGRAVADAATAMGGPRILVAAGPGNNGGDAMVAARILLARGATVTVALARPLEDLGGLAALAARRFLDAGGGLCPAHEAAWQTADLIVDGLLGTGIAGPPREPIASVIAAINAAARPVLSIDVPSGLDADRGDAPETAVRASRTVALAALKPALLHFPAANWAGEVSLADLGMPHALYPPPASVLLSSAFVRDALPVFARDAHKGTRGTLLAVAGSRGMAGAAALACRAATLAGAGLVRLACPERLIPAVEVKLTDQVLRPLPDGGAGALSVESLDGALEAMEGADAVVLGPGIGRGDGVEGFVMAFAARVDRPMLLDADGLNALARLRFPVPPRTVLTPHPGEMARLLGGSIADIEADRVASARRAAETFGCAVVLKGAHTVVAAPDRPAVVNTLSHPVLGTAGSGDVLSGVIGALLAQGIDPFDAALAGVRWHGTMGTLAASNRGGTLGASDLVEYLPRAREEIRNSDVIEIMA